MYCSENCASFLTGVTKVDTYSEKVIRVTKSIFPRMIRKPPKATTTTCMMPVVNSMPDMNRPMDL